MVPELDPIWRLAYWLVMGIAIGVSVLAVIVLVIDVLRELRHDPPDPYRSDIRDRLRQLSKSPPQ